MQTSAERSRFDMTLNYSASNEDSESECRALRLGPDDTVLCITGSGDRVLNLLTRGPRRIAAVDCNRPQNHLLRLKIAAISRLDYPDLLALLGVTHSDRRIKLYEALRELIPGESRRFWDARGDLLRRGVIYAGRWENHFRRLAQAVGLVRGRLRRRLFACSSIGEQESIWNEWSRGLWHGLIRSTTAYPVWRYVLKDPGFYRFVAPEFAVSDYVHRRLNEAVRNFFLRESHFARLLFFGRYDEAGPLPPYLHPKAHDTVREGLSNINVFDGALQDILETCQERFTAYSLSDFASYTDRADYARVWSGILRTAATGARFCERQFLVKRPPPAFAAGRLKRDATLEDMLAREDGSIFYTFRVGAIRNGISNSTQGQKVSSAR